MYWMVCTGSNHTHAAITQCTYCTMPRVLITPIWCSRSHTYIMYSNRLLLYQFLNKHIYFSMPAFSCAMPWFSHNICIYMFDRPWPANALWALFCINHSSAHFWAHGIVNGGWWQQSLLFSRMSSHHRKFRSTLQLDMVASPQAHVHMSAWNTQPKAQPRLTVLAVGKLIFGFLWCIWRDDTHPPTGENTTYYTVLHTLIQHLLTAAI